MDKRKIYYTVGGYSLCRYQKALIHACIESGNNYDRVFFLSGQDYPLWSNKEITAFLREHPNDEIIAAKNITTSADERQQRRINQYHFFRDLPIRNRKIHRVFKGVAQMAMRYTPVKRKNYIVTNGKKCCVYYGSQWWCVTGKCLRYVFDEMFNNPDWEKYFRFTYAPDEMMIQTIVFNSPYAKHALLFPDSTRGLPSLTPLHYIEYDKNIAIYDEKDFDKLMCSKKMFVRKLVSGKSDKLMELIDKRRKQDEIE